MIVTSVMKELSNCKCNLKATANNYTEFEEEQKLLGKRLIITFL